MDRVSISRPWWAPDQPGYVCGGGDKGGNSYKCVGWNGVPTDDACDADFVTQCRVCRCLSKDDNANAKVSAPSGVTTSRSNPSGRALETAAFLASISADMVCKCYL